jgi:ribosome maturation factor RimP
MGTDDRAAFSLGLRLLAVVFRAKASPPLVEVYFRALSEFDLADVKQAMKTAAACDDWFPKPVELRQTIEVGLERDYQRKVQAWNEEKRAEMGDD